MIKNVFSWFKNWYLYGTIAIVYLVYVTFPGYYQPISAGLDNSWIYAINYLPNSSSFMDTNRYDRTGSSPREEKQIALWGRANINYINYKKAEGNFYNSDSR